MNYKHIKSFFKAINVAFSMYSKIPMPQFNWATEDMKYHLCFFPWIGFVIGILEYLLYRTYTAFLFNCILYYSLSIAIPLLITGGFHVDGFMDTMDALHSYQSKEKKLEILKDPHIGAFSVICLISYFILAFGFITEIKTREAVIAICFVFFNSRALSGISVTYFPKAKKEGMVYTSSNTEDKKVVGFFLIVQLIMSLILMFILLWPSWIYFASALISLICTFIYYYKMSVKQFGGITGDLSGYFVVISELVSIIVIATCSIILERI